MSAEPEEPQPLYRRELGDEYEVVVYPMTFGKARLCIGRVGDAGYERGYCYENPAIAVSAAVLWNGQGDPLDGWHREVSSGRRRQNGDPTKETVRW